MKRKEIEKRHGEKTETWEKIFLKDERKAVCRKGKADVLLV